MAHSIHVLGQSLELHQAPDGFKSGTDAVFLAAACPAQSGETLLDLGCGVGTAGLCAVKRIGPVQLTGVDLQKDHIELARQNAALNDLDATYICEDIRDLKNERFNHVICNPPYGHDQADIAKGETNLDEWINCALRNLKGRGTFTIVHRADHLDQILVSFAGRFGGIEVIPLWPKAGEAAKRVVIRAVKDSKSPATVHAGLMVHQKNGDYTDKAEEILRNAAALL